MAEENAAGVETIDTDTASTTQTTSTETYINPDGTFKEGWQGKHVPEEHRSNTTWLGVKSVDDMVNQISHLNSKLTKQGKGVFPITEKSTAQEVAEFRTAMGIPDTPDGYTLNIPKEVEKYYQDQELMTEAKATMHKLGLTPKQFAGVMALDATRMLKSEEAMKADPLAFYEQALDLAMPTMKEQAETELRTKWGEAYDARLQLANAAITENTKEGDERNQLLERIGNDPLVADFIATIQNKHYTESHGIDTSLGRGTMSKNLQQQIDEIGQQLTPELKLKDRTRYDSLLIQKNKLYSQLFPEK